MLCYGIICVSSFPRPVTICNNYVQRFWKVWKGIKASQDIICWHSFIISAPNMQTIKAYSNWSCSVLQIQYRGFRTLNPLYCISVQFSTLFHSTYKSKWWALSRNPKVFFLRFLALFRNLTCTTSFSCGYRTTELIGPLSSTHEVRGNLFIDRHILICNTKWLCCYRWSLFSTTEIINLDMGHKISLFYWHCLLQVWIQMKC